MPEPLYYDPNTGLPTDLAWATINNSACEDEERPAYTLARLERERDEAIKKYQTEHRLREALEETRVAYGDNRVMGVERERDALRRVLDIIKDYCDSDVLAYAGHSVDELVTQEMRNA